MFFVLVLSIAVLVLDSSTVDLSVWRINWGHFEYEYEYRLTPEYEYDSGLGLLLGAFLKPPALQVVIDYFQLLTMLEGEFKEFHNSLSYRGLQFGDEHLIFKKQRYNVALI